MPHEALGRLHAALFSALQSVRSDERGQGTVEYIALVLLLGAVFAVVATKGKDQDWGIPDLIQDKLTAAIKDVTGK